MTNIILTQQGIINTYDKVQKEQSRLYLEYKRIKKENPGFGYKRISKLLEQPYHKTRWWHSKKFIPYPIQTVNWLMERKLIPLTEDDERLPLISKVLGTTFGDGGIFGNLNGIFISSSELESVKEFGEDIKIIFGNEIEQNSRIVEGGVYGHSWSYQNTNRNVIRFFQSLGSPIGRKSEIELKVPRWIQNSSSKDEYFGSFFGNEINIPKVHINKNHLDTLSVGITGSSKRKENRIEFLQEIKQYLENKGIKTGTISISKDKRYEDMFIIKLLISTKLDNILKFKKKIKINYTTYKREKLENTIKEFIKIKRKRFKDLTIRGYSNESTLKLLKIKKLQKQTSTF